MELTNQDGHALIRRRTERKYIVLLLHFTVTMHWHNVSTMRCCLVLFGALTLLPVYNGECQNKQPHRCNFEAGCCDQWNKQNWTCCNDTNNHFACLENMKSNGYMESPLFCATSATSHCLTLRFLLKKKADQLNVSISWPYNETEKLLWSHSGKVDSWTSASVPVMSDLSFTLMITGTRTNGNAIKRPVLVDDIDFTTSNCTILSTSAAPSKETTFTTTTATAGTTATTTATKTSMVTTEKMTISTHVNIKTTASVGTSGSQASHDNIGTTVGIIVTIIFIATIGLIIFFVVRRKQISLKHVCFADKKEHSNGEGYNNVAYDTTHDNALSAEYYTELSTPVADQPYANYPGTITTMADARLSTSEYSVIRDPEYDNYSYTAFQPLTSVYCEAQILSSTKKKNHEDPDTDVQENIMAKQPGKACEETEYKNIGTHQPDQVAMDSKSIATSEGNSNKIYSHSTYSLAQPYQADNVYQNVTDGLDGQVLHEETEYRQKGKAEKDGELEKHKVQDKRSEYCNIKQTTKTSNSEADTGVYHIPEEEDTQNVPTEGVYHILEPGTSENETDGQKAGVYHILEETKDRNPNMTNSRNENSSVPQGSKGDYNTLDLNKKPFSEEDCDDMSKAYSHLNEIEEDTYDELNREKKRKVVDGNYSRVQVE